MFIIAIEIFATGFYNAELHKYKHIEGGFLIYVKNVP
nr:MAG TPA: hypothetical protein [Caudoviricetes sp.]